MSDKLIQLVYESKASRPFSQEELKALLKTARQNNTERGISGMLLYANGNFLQVLEGPEQEVNEIYSIIEKDDRHSEIRPYGDKVIRNRDFPDWSMGFKYLSEEDQKNLEGFNDFFNTDHDISTYNFSDVLMILTLFKTMN